MGEVGLECGILDPGLRDLVPKSTRSYSYWYCILEDFEAVEDLPEVGSQDS
jgi:hypothetical protein